MIFVKHPIQIFLCYKKLNTCICKSVPEKTQQFKNFVISVQNCHMSGANSKFLTMFIL